MLQVRCAGRTAAKGSFNAACFDRCVTGVGVHLLKGAGLPVGLAWLKVLTVADT
jgi:hypothetical protein